MNLALIVAAGKGTRMGVPGGKQLMLVRDKPVLAHTLIAFQQATTIDAILIVTAEENIEKCLELVDAHGILKADRIVLGGDERQDSVYNGLKAAAELKTVRRVIVHDGARPLVTPQIIDEAVLALDGADGVVVGIPAKDTIKLVREGVVSQTLDRARVWQVQTPQVFYLDVLLRAHEHAQAEGFYGTDDAVLVERTGGLVKVVAGSDENIKVTTPIDVLIAEAILAAREVT